jgi:hypothetical protein
MNVMEGARDIEVSLHVTFEQHQTQGVGYYVRQNGGCLRDTQAHGAGYAVFLEGFRGPRIGVWREIDGVEQEISYFTGISLASNVAYAVRFRVVQETPTTTRLQARVWPAGGVEPSTWLVNAIDTTPSLQNVAGGMAVDSYSAVKSGTLTLGTLVDEIHARPL